MMLCLGSYRTLGCRRSGLFGVVVVFSLMVSSLIWCSVSVVRVTVSLR